MRTLFRLSLALATTLAVSCIQDDVKEPDFTMIEAVAELPEQCDVFVGTRSIVQENDTNIDMIWDVSESIGVYGSGLTNSKFVGTNKYREAASTTFKGGSFLS